MVSFKELKSRVKEFLRFDQQELSGLIPAILITAFIFSFKDWGVETFNLMIGFKNLFLVTIIAAFTFFFRISCQKIYALSEGYKTEFKVWWTGLLIALVVAFMSMGRIPLVLIGAAVSAFMVKQRLGEFRYGHSHAQNGMIAFFGIIGNLILAIIFTVGLYVFPESYFFNKALILNLIMAFCSLIPLPQLDGLQIYFGSRNLYFAGIIITGIISALLLWTKLTGTKIGLIVAIVLSAVAGVTYTLIGSEV